MGGGVMSAKKCLNNHNIQGISSSGFDNGYFGYIRHDFYCHACNKAKTIKEFWVKFPKFKRKSDLPF